MYAKKSLGQNWLKSESAVKLIVATAELAPGETVLEIGPGRGVLTEALLGTGAKVIAVEKDDRLIELLNQKFADEIKTKKLTLIHGDILNLNWSETADKSKLKQYKLVANIPYYLTGQIIRKFLSEEEHQPEKMVMMLQKEVAKRLVAGDKKESLLSIAVKIYGQPKYIKTVPAGAFEPRPKVDSAILLIANIARDNFKNQKIDEEKFFGILHRSFGQKRKMLANNLKLDSTIMQTCRLDAKIRAENLTVADWLCLAKQLTRSADNAD